MGFLDELRARVGRSSANEAEHALAVTELAECEPLLGNRVAPVRAAIDAAARVLDRAAGDTIPELRARLLLRLSQLAIVETDYEAADRALEAVGDHVPDHRALRFLAGIRACRIALRRGPQDRAVASDVVLKSAAQIERFDEGDAYWQRATTELALAAAELAIHDQPSDPHAFAALRELVGEVADRPEHVDTVFVARQLLATYALSTGDATTAAHLFRALIKMSVAADAATDEIEARLALAAVLVDGTAALGGQVARDEAKHHVQRAKARARDHGIPQLFQAAQLAEAGLAASTGKIADAIDHVLELARDAVAHEDIPRYVAAVGIMAELYARSGDVVSAFRTIVEAHRALADATGADLRPLFRPHLITLRDRIGAARLDQIAADVARADHLLSELRPRTSNDPS